MQGKLVVLDGMDSSGKHTQTELLARRLQGEGKKTKAISFPTYERTPFGKLVSNYLNGEYGQREDVPREIACLLYALDRYALAAEIRSLLDDGFFVLLDRYTPANLAYQTAEMSDKPRSEFIKWLEGLESRLPAPDVVLFLDLPVEESLKLMESRPPKNPFLKTKKDVHESDENYLKKVRENYLRLAKEKKWVVVNCLNSRGLKTISEINDEIYSLLKTRKFI